MILLRLLRMVYILRRLPYITVAAKLTILTPAMNPLNSLRSRSLLIAAVLAATISAFSPAHSALIFTENFDYTIGSNLAGQNGGSGFSGAWTGGNSTIVAGLGGTGNAVQIGASIASRSLSSTFSTSGNTFYVSYLMNASNFAGGAYTGISLWNDASEELFFGIPYQSQNFGFDARGGTGVAGIQEVDFSPSINTTYLITFGLLPSATSGKVDLKMWATSNLGVDPNTLVAGAANASLLGTRDNFSFNTLKLNGDYAGSLKVSGIANAPTAAEAINFSTQSAAPVPEPGTWAAAALLGGGAAFVRWRKRAKVS